MARSSWTRRCALLFLFTTIGCSRPTDQSGPARSGVPVHTTAPASPAQRLRAPWELTRAESDALLLTDSSMSMAGYDRGPKSELRLLLNAMELQFMVAGVNHFQAATFSEQVGTVSDAASVAGMLNSRFDGQTTCLAAPWEANGKGFRMILTDGVPSAGARASTKSQSCSCPVTDPTNVNCISRAIVNFAQQGNGVWVIGVKATFSGRYYPELPPKSPFSASNTVRRPVYVWLGGPNIDQGRRIVSETLQSLAKQGVKDSFAIEVWPGEWSGIQQGPLTTGSFRVTDAKATQKCGASQPSVLSIQDRTLVLKKPTGVQQLLLTVRVPTEAIVSQLPPLILPLVAVTMSKDIQVIGGRAIWLTDDQQGGCFDLLGASEVEWQTRSAMSPSNLNLADWSTGDDAAQVNIDRTLFLSELWDTTAKLLASPSNRIHVTLMRAVLQ